MQYSKWIHVMSITFQLACLTTGQIYYVHSPFLHGSAQRTKYKEIPSKVLLTSGKPRFFCWNCQHMDHGLPFIITTSTLISMNQYVNQASLKRNFFLAISPHLSWNYNTLSISYDEHIQVALESFPRKFHSSYIYTPTQRSFSSS